MIRAVFRAAAIALLCLAGAGCAGGPGAFCTRDNECRAGLICVRPGSARGVCTYPPPATLDAAAREARPPLPSFDGGTRDRGQTEGRRLDARLDARQPGDLPREQAASGG